MNLWDEAKARSQLHRDAGNFVESLGGDSDLTNFMGLVGEQAFAASFGVERDRQLRVFGDGGVDFRIWLLDDAGIPRLTEIDVKTFQKPNSLLVKCSEIVPERIYILGRYFPDKSVSLLGWEWGWMLQASEPKQFKPGGPMNYHLPREALWPMRVLHRRHRKKAPEGA